MTTSPVPASKARLGAGLLLLAAGLTAVVSGVAASGPAFWTVATASDFLKGTSDGALVSLDGVLSAGPQLTSRLTAAPAQIWSLAAASDGTLWAGTGGDGKLLRIRPGQNEDTPFDADANSIFAVAVSGNRVYAASSPDGRVYVIDGNQPARPFFDPEEKYIWALAVDGTGRLWVGAGNPAVIYRVDDNGTGRAIYKPPAAHVVSLVRDANGRMLAGTESPGRLYRIEADDRAFVLLDSGLAEMRAISTTTSGTIFAAAISKSDEGGSSGESGSIAIASAPPPTPGSATSSSSTSSSSAKRSVVYRIEASGAWEPIWDSSDVIYDLSATSDGGVLAATGPDGRLYKIDARRQVSLLSGVDAKQITRFAVGSGPGNAEAQAFATANPGRVISIGARPQSPATYISSARDTKSASAWGMIRWESTGAIQLFTRSGNTEKPDDSWSAWGGPYTRKDGEVIKSPTARFVQWKAVITQSAAASASTPAPSLTSVTVAYLPRNSRPEVTSITIPAPGVVFQRPFASEEGAIAGLDDVTADARRPPGDAGPPTPSPGRRMFQKGLQTIQWKAEDTDSDHLSYTLQYRREGELTWHDLRRDLSETIFVWDTTSMADGRYIVRVSASDAPSNAADRMLTGDRISDPIEIDNTPPAITTEIARTGATAKLVVHVRDLQSPIQKVEYSIGGGSWQLIYPVDGLSDSPSETYEIPLATEADATRIVVRATDLLQNVTSQAVK